MMRRARCLYRSPPPSDDSYLGPLRDLDLSLFIVARNESSEMECQEKHGGDQQGCRR